MGCCGPFFLGTRGTLSSMGESAARNAPRWEASAGVSFSVVDAGVMGSSFSAKAFKYAVWKADS